MTAPAAAPASAPIAPAAPRAAPQPPADRFAFAAMLDSLPSAPAKATASGGEEQAPPSNESPQDESSRGRASHHSALNDSALFTSLPFALRVGSMMDERAQAADNAPSLPSPAMKGPKSENSGASLAASAKAPAVGRLIGERAFHLGASTFAGVIASRTSAIEAPFAPGAASAANLAPQADRSGESLLAGGFPRAEAMAAKPLADAVPSTANETVAAPTALHTGARSANRVSPTRAAAHEAARSGRNPEVSASPPLARAPSSTSPPAPAESSANGKRTDDRPPDPVAFAAPSTAQTGSFGAPPPGPFVAGAAFGPDASTAGATDTDAAPRATALGPGSAPSAPPVREIDVDLSPGGLEDVSMTMRLAGDKLSVVIRAASSQTLGSIEGARDAITDRMAAIGQPLDSLIVKQASVNTDGNANGNGTPADGGSAGGEQRSAHGAGERGGSNDASLFRRGAARDRSF
jgi:Flagellar hook-length control protein FliK